MPIFDPLRILYFSHNNIFQYRIILINLSFEKDKSLLKSFSAKKINSNLLIPNIENAKPDNPFYNKKIVFTGDLNNISRQEAAIKIQNLGADINTSISKKTEIVIVGNGAGPSKMKKIEELNLQGYNIKLIYEDEFLSIINCAK